MLLPWIFQIATLSLAEIILNLIQSHWINLYIRYTRILSSWHLKYLTWVDWLTRLILYPCWNPSMAVSKYDCKCTSVIGAPSLLKYRGVDRGSILTPRHDHANAWFHFDLVTCWMSIESLDSIAIQQMRTPMIRCGYPLEASVIAVFTWFSDLNSPANGINFSYRYWHEWVTWSCSHFIDFFTSNITITYPASCSSCVIPFI